MLVLTRRVGEQIVIEQAIRITVVAVKGSNVRLGVTAPESVRVDRAEVHNRRGVQGHCGHEVAFLSPSPSGESLMRTVQPGDHVQVHYVKLYQDGGVVSSRSRGVAPVELTVGIDHPRLRGLGLSLVGSAPGQHVALTVPPERAFGLADPGRIRRLARRRFSGLKTLPLGKWVRILDRKGRVRPVRIMEVGDRVVVVDTNHPRAGQTLELDVELIAIHGPDDSSDSQQL